ncbi:hypothetical protein AH06_01705, partial [candidate division TM6 bacterium Zodletone_IIa]
MEHVSIIGAGTMGNGIAHVFALNGFKVALIDVNQTQLDKALATIAKNLDRQVAKGIITVEKKMGTLQNIITHTGIEKGVQEAALVVEAATENIAIKLQLFQQ